MKNTRRQIILILACGLFLAAFFLSRPAMTEDKTVTNDDVYKILHKSSPDFVKSHSVMRHQKMKLAAIYEGFLVGDTERIAEESNALLKDMNQLILDNIPTPESEPSVWRSVTEIVEETRLMKEEASNQNYSGAYGHFTRITASCIQCHQTAREWGKFPNPTAPSAEDNTSTERERK